MRAVLWDLDGTLLPDNIYPPQAAAMREALRIVWGVQHDHGVDWVGKTDVLLAYEIAAAAGIDEGEVWDDLEVWKRCYRRQFTARCPQRIEPRDGASDALWDLEDRGVLCQVVTGNIRPVAEYKLERAGLVVHTQGSGFGDDAMNRADIIRVALGRMDMTPDEAVLVGDTWRDVEAASQVGVPCIALATPKHSAEELRARGAERVEDSIPAVLDAIMASA